MTTELTEIIEASHWIYLPTQGATDAAQRELEFLGFLVETEDVERDDDHRWLVRAFHLISERDEHQDAIALVGRIAEAHGGHYDGGELGRRARGELFVGSTLVRPLGSFEEAVEELRQMDAGVEIVTGPEAEELLRKVVEVERTRMEEAASG